MRLFFQSIAWQAASTTTSHRKTTAVIKIPKPSFWFHTRISWIIFNEFLFQGKRYGTTKWTREWDAWTKWEGSLSTTATQSAILWGAACPFTVLRRARSFSGSPLHWLSPPPMTSSSARTERLKVSRWQSWMFTRVPRELFREKPLRIACCTFRFCQMRSCWQHIVRLPKEERGSYACSICKRTAMKCKKAWS